MQRNKIDHSNNDSTVHWIYTLSLYEQHYEKTCFFHTGKQRGRSAKWYCAADQRLCFHYIDSTSPLKFKASSHLLLLYSQVCVGNPEDRFWFWVAGRSPFEK